MSITLWVRPVVCNQTTGLDAFLRPHLDRVAAWWEEVAGVYIGWPLVRVLGELPRDTQGGFLWDSRNSLRDCWLGANLAGAAQRAQGRAGWDSNHRYLLIDPQHGPPGLDGLPGTSNHETAFLSRTLVELLAANHNDAADGLLAHMVGHLLGFRHTPEGLMGEWWRFPTVPLLEPANGPYHEPIEPCPAWRR